MRVVLALSEPPAREGGAPGRCSVGLVLGLASHGVDVEALAAHQWFSPRARADGDLDVRVVEVPPEPPSGKARALRWTRARGELGRGPLAAAVREAARGADVVHLDGVDTSWCDAGVGVPSVLHLHYLAHADRPFGPPWQRQFREVLEFTLGERSGVKRHRYLVANSPVVADALRHMTRRDNVTLASLTLDPGAYPAAPLDGPPTAGIIGTASWGPTASAMELLVHRVWPRVRGEIPEARLVVAGRGVDRLGLAGPGVEVVGEVGSAAGFLGSLSALVYPVPRGSGMKVKALEALASGLPVVTTACGAEGIVPNDGVAITEGDGALAGAAIEILTDEAARRQRGEAARAAFLAHHAPGPATAPLADLYRRMVPST